MMLAEFLTFCSPFLLQAKCASSSRANIICNEIKGLPFTLGRKVDAQGDCFFDSILAQLCDPRIEPTLPSHIKAIKTIKVCFFSSNFDVKSKNFLSHATKVIFLLNCSN